MNLYELSHTLISMLKQNDIINTITTVPTTEIDNFELTVYPLVNLELTDSVPGDYTQTFNFEIQLLQQAEILKTTTEYKWDNTNLIDNYNELNHVAYSFIQHIKMTKDINLVFNPSFFYMKNVGINGLDGIRFTLTVEVPSDTICVKNQDR